MKLLMPACLFSLLYQGLAGFGDLNGVATPFSAPLTAQAQGSPACPQPALSRLKRHQVRSGETLAGIAQRYNLIPATLLGLNPSIRGGQVSPGSQLVIPPFNGIQVTVPTGQTWRDIATRYGVRADVLFEVNGCQPSPTIVFVPGVNWSPLARSTNEAGNLSPFSSYPLPRLPALPNQSPADTIALGYGWQLYPGATEVAFHSGVDLIAAIGTPVLSIGSGTVAFAGNQGSYGNLVVINHAGGQQSRYAHLDRIQVQTGQSVRSGTTLGTVGTTGTRSSQVSHLHFELRQSSNLGWVAEDPRPYLQPRAAAQPTRSANQSSP